MTAFRRFTMLRCLIALTMLGVLPSTPASAAGEVVTLPLTFQVRNVNRSQVPCLADGRSYLVRGRLVTPVGGALPGSVTLYQHGLGAAGLFDFTATAGYDFARTMAEQGHAAVVIESLGYLPSDRPPGLGVCLGSQADVVHQVVTALRSGDYQVAGGAGASPRFDRVALVGASFGGLIAEIEAHSFTDLDALAVMSWADQGFSPLAGLTFAETTAYCAAGTLAPPDAAPPGYAYFGQTAQDFERLFFADADPAVVGSAYSTRSADPCGEEGSFAQAVLANITGAARIRVPVLLMYGTNDALFPLPAQAVQAALYLAAPSLTTVSIDGGGHYLPLERSHQAVATQLARWLAQQHF